MKSIHSAIASLVLFAAAGAALAGPIEYRVPTHGVVTTASAPAVPDTPAAPAVPSTYSIGYNRSASYQWDNWGRGCNFYQSSGQAIIMIDGKNYYTQIAGRAGDHYRLIWSGAGLSFTSGDDWAGVSYDSDVGIESAACSGGSTQYFTVNLSIIDTATGVALAADGPTSLQIMQKSF